MEADPNVANQGTPDPANHAVMQGTGDSMVKNAGCNSLIMKNFENPTTLIRLGVGRANNATLPKTVNFPTMTGVNEDSLNKFVSSTIQANQHATDLQKNQRERQPEPTSGATTPPGTRPPNKSPNMNSSMNNNHSSANMAQNGSQHAPGHKRGHGPAHFPLNAQFTPSALKPAKGLAKLQPPQFSRITRSSLGHANLDMQNPSRIACPLAHLCPREGPNSNQLKNSFENTGANHEAHDERLWFAGENCEATSASQDTEGEGAHKGADAAEQSNAAAAYYTSVFENSDESLSLLRKLFTNPPAEPAAGSTESDGPAIDTDHFEWIPNEPTDACPLSNKGEIAGLFEDNFEEECDGYLISNYYNASQHDLDVKLRNLSSIHESLYTSSDAATLRTTEKFLLQLLQQKNYYGSLTPFGKLLAFINLSFLRKHITLLDALYSHPEMAVIRDVLTNNAQGQIAKTLNTSAGIGDAKVTSEEALTIFTQVLNKTNRDAGLALNANNTTMRNRYLSSGLKQNKQRLKVIDTLSGMYKAGGEPHFPRFVCGSVDRNFVIGSETLSIPFEKSDKHTVHVQFERFDDESARMWPETTLLPQNISEGRRGSRAGTFVQVAPLKYGSMMTWKAGMVVSLASGQLMIKVPNEQKERMYLLRNLVPPNVPVVKLEKGYWRLLPRELDVTKDLYVGSCLSLLDLAEPEESVDVVVLNLFFGKDDSPIAPVKLPADETNFQHAESGEAKSDAARQAAEGSPNPNCVKGFDVGSLDENEAAPAQRTRASGQEAGTCSCNGHTLRVFEGKFVGIPERILVHCLHDRKDHVLSVSSLKGFKLNYDLQAHFDGPAASVPLSHCLWVVPRNISFLGDSLSVKDSNKPGCAWLFKPDYCLVMFPFNRNIDALTDFCRLIPFLHPELNYLALCAGLWSFRNKPEIKERDTVSYTRSQKAAIRDLTTNDVVSEVCNELIRCPFPLVRRLYGCFPVISLWIALDAYDPEGEQDPAIPTNIKVPKFTDCEKCGGMVISRTGMVRIITNKYTQLLAKKIARKSREGANNPSLETLPQVDADAPPRGKESEPSDRDESSSDREPEPAEKAAAEDDKPEAEPKDAETLRKDMEEVSKAMEGPESVFSDLGDADRRTVPIQDALFGSDPELEVSPVLCDLEKAEDLVKRAQSLANSRWRVTKEFNASYLVDDEFAILTGSQAANGQSKTNSEFLIQLAGVMNNVKRGRDLHIDPNLVYQLYQLSEECCSTTEGALLTGWSTYILAEQRAVEDSQLAGFAVSRPEPPKAAPATCPLNFSCPRGANCPCMGATIGPCPVKLAPPPPLAPPDRLNAFKCPVRKCPVDLSTNYTQLLEKNPILTNLSGMYKRKRDEELKKMGALKSQKGANAGAIPKLGTKSEPPNSRGPPKDEEDNPYIDDPYDFCKFTDNPKRKRYVASVKWDEDVEF